MLYTVLKHNTPLIRELQALGVVSPTWLRNVEIFEKFHLDPKATAEDRYAWLAEEYGFKDPSSIKKIVSAMKK